VSTLELDEKESEVVVVLVRRFARRLREDVSGAILMNIPSGILDDKGVVALANKIENLTIREGLRDRDDVQMGAPSYLPDSFDTITVNVLLDLLGLVMAPDEMPSDKMLEGLTREQLEEVGRWCGDVHLGASDNPVEAGPMPVCLRDHLPDGHTYKTWRV
jgi:hypothetical protein